MCSGIFFLKDFFPFDASFQSSGARSDYGNFRWKKIYMYIRPTCKTPGALGGNGGPLDGSFDSEIIIRLVRTRRNEETLARK